MERGRGTAQVLFIIIQRINIFHSDVYIDLFCYFFIFSVIHHVSFSHFPYSSYAHVLKPSCAYVGESIE